VVTTLVVQVAVHVAALTPLAWLLIDAWRGALTVNPIQALTLRTGKYALILLTLSLACTPVVSLLGLRPAARWRRPLGVYAALYAGLHFLIFAVLDYGLDPLLLREAIFEKPFALVGFAAGLILLPLALTSTASAMRRMGARWKRLHRLVYLAGGLAVLHYTWAVKADLSQPLLFAAAIGLLLALRLPWVKRMALRLRRRMAR
jgi:sulfoxide reductase heme-binding subunit YedZ